MAGGPLHRNPREKSEGVLGAEENITKSSQEPTGMIQPDRSKYRSGNSLQCLGRHRAERVSVGREGKTQDRPLGGRADAECQLSR